LSYYDSVTDTQGAEWIMSQLYQDIFVPAQNKHVVFSLLTKVPMGRNTKLTFPRITPGQKFTAAGVAEAGVKSPSKALTSDVDLELKMFYVLFETTTQFLRHSVPGAKQVLLDKAAQDLVDVIETEIYHSPLGFFSGFESQVTPCSVDLSGAFPCVPCISGQMNYQDVADATTAVEQRGYIDNLSAIVDVFSFGQLRTDRNADGTYILSPLADGRGLLSAWGVKIYPSANMRRQYGIVGDFSKALYADSGAIAITRNDQAANAFLYNKVWFRLEIEAAFAILDVNAFETIC